MGSYDCECKDGDKGKSCFDNCAIKPCENGGTCTVITTTNYRGMDLITSLLHRIS